MTCGGNSIDLFTVANQLRNSFGAYRKLRVKSEIEK
jgi:hypothetical protein